MDTPTTQPPASGAKAALRTDQAPAEGDFAWPPPTGDLDACLVVRLDCDFDRELLPIVGGFPIPDYDVRLRPNPHLAPPPVALGGFPLRVSSARPMSLPPPLPMLTRPLAQEPPPLPVPPPLPLPLLVSPPAIAGVAEAPNIFAETGLWGVTRRRIVLPPVAESDDATADTSSVGPRSRAALALFVAASLALLSWSEFRAQRRELASVSSVAVRMSAPAQQTPAVALPEAPAVAASAGAAEPVTVERIALQPEPRHQRLAVAETSRPVPGADVMTAARRERPQPAAIVAAPRSQTLASMPAPSAVGLRADGGLHVDSRPVPAAPAPMREAAVVPVAVALAPTAAPEVAMVTAAVEIGPSDEERIRTTLARWRTAYSQLDARAAKHVWPSVDERALERAFQALKSQDVSFDRCNFTVNDASAQADCTGRSSYVPRVGNQTPRTLPREWRFQLRRFDEGWTISSARSS